MIFSVNTVLNQICLSLLSRVTGGTISGSTMTTPYTCWLLALRLKCSTTWQNAKSLFGIPMGQKMKSLFSNLRTENTPLEEEAPLDFVRLLLTTIWDFAILFLF